MVSAKKVLILITNGTEEIEASILLYLRNLAVPVDVLRRAGVTVTLAGLESALPVKGANGMILTPDIALDEISDLDSFDMIVLPGGNLGAK